ncbi:hypothetical protein JCM8547_007594 [Rhodosporidiobolus lusitaniae]
MPPRRARASSVSSTTSASAPRRSSRASKPPPSPAAPRNPTKKVVRGKRAASVASDISEEDSEEEEEDSDDGASTSGSRKRKAPSKANGAPRKKASTDKGARAIKKAPKPRRAPVSGMNPLPKLFDLFPLHSSFSGFDIPTLPEADVAPRTIFVFGTGDMGQFGLGTDVLDEIKRPRRHATFKEKIEKEEDGWAGGAADVYCGGMHTLAVDGEGKVWSWGINDNAALGRVTSKPDVEAEELESNPFPVENLKVSPDVPFKAVRVSAGDSVSLAVSDHGDVRAWGSFRSAEGLLGFDGSKGSDKMQLVPTALANLDKHTFVQVECGADHFLALTTTGFVFACGNGEQNQLGRKIIQRHKSHGLTPERLALKNIVLVGTGSYHSFAVNKDGEVYAWGLNSFHQTGVDEDDGGYADVISTPTRVAALSPKEHDGARVVQITAGAHHSLFLFSNGEVFACGRCDGHEVGLPDDHEELKASNERKEEAKKQRKEREKEELAARHAEDGTTVTATDDDGKLLTTEEAAFAAMEAAAQGVPLPNDYIPLPTRVEFPKEPKDNATVRGFKKLDDFEDDGVETEETKIVQLKAGPRHNFAVSSRGYVYSWGVGPSSQLGQGDEEEIETPRRIWNTALNNVRVIRAETGGQHAVLLGVDRDAEDTHVERVKAREAKKAEEEKARKEKEDAERKAKEEEEAKAAAEKPAEDNSEDIKMKEGESAEEEAKENGTAEEEKENE